MEDSVMAGIRPGGGLLQMRLCWTAGVGSGLREETQGCDFWRNPGVSLVRCIELGSEEFHPTHVITGR